VLAPVLVAEIRVARAAADDERVVADRRLGRDAVDRPQVQLAPVEIEVGDFGHQHADVAIALEDRAQRIGDLPRRESAGRHLVGERLEEMEVPPIDERDVDGGTSETQDGLEPTEATSDHNHSVRATPSLRHSPCG
jgi:hypothetical protein